MNYFISLTPVIDSMMGSLEKISAGSEEVLGLELGIGCLVKSSVHPSEPYPQNKTKNVIPAAQGL